MWSAEPRRDKQGRASEGGRAGARVGHWTRARGSPGQGVITEIYYVYTIKGRL